MPIFVPLRVLTLLIGCILGCATGTYIEMLYYTQGDYTEAVERILDSVKSGYNSLRNSMHLSDDEHSISHMCTDCCDSATDTSESEESD